MRMQGGGRAGRSALGRLAAIAVAGLPAAAGAAPLTPPIEQVLIPVAVGAAFALPALLALAYAVLWRFVRRVGPVGGVCALAVAVLAVVGLLQPGVIPALMGGG